MTQNVSTSCAMRVASLDSVERVVTDAGNRTKCRDAVDAPPNSRQNKFMYRTARNTSTPDTILTCRACAATTTFPFGSHGVFTCEACGREQPVLRALDDLKLLESNLVQASESKVYKELAPFVESLTGKYDNATEVKVQCDGMVLVVAITLNSGAVTGTDIVVMFDRSNKTKGVTPTGEGFPPMNLLPEDGTHRKAKETGLSREAQTGDEEFDAAVYIESQLTDASIHRFLSSPAVRKAVMRLVRDTSQIQVGPDKITMYVPKDKAFDPTLIRERLTCLRVLAGAPRLIFTEIVPETRAVRVTKRLGLFVAPVGLGLGLYGWIAHGPVGYKPYVSCIGAGLALTLLARPILRRIFRGRSTSHTDLIVATIIGLLFSPLLIMGLLFPLNAWLATSPERRVVMRVARASVDSDDASKLDVEAVDPDDSTTHGYHFNAPKPQGEAFVIARWRRGALGWTFEIGDPVLQITRPN